MHDVYHVTKILPPFSTIVGIIATAVLLGILLTTPMAAYAGDGDDRGDGEERETNTDVGSYKSDHSHQSGPPLYPDLQTAPPSRLVG